MAMWIQRLAASWGDVVRTTTEPARQSSRIAPFHPLAGASDNGHIKDAKLHTSRGASRVKNASKPTSLAARKQTKKLDKKLFKPVLAEILTHTDVSAHAKTLSSMKSKLSKAALSSDAHGDSDMSFNPVHSSPNQSHTRLRKTARSQSPLSTRRRARLMKRGSAFSGTATRGHVPAAQTRTLRRQASRVRVASRADAPSSATRSAAQAKVRAFAAKLKKRAAERQTKFAIDKWNRLLSRHSGNTSSLFRSDPKLILLVRELGVPPSLRARVWARLLGSDEARKAHAGQYYRTLVELAERYSADHKDDPRSFHREIEKDITRSAPDGDATSTPKTRGALRRVLCAYYLHDPSTVGYCQSMNIVAWGLLAAVGDEEAVFWMLVCVVRQRVGYYSRSMAGLQVDQRVFDSLCAYKLPEIHERFASRSADVSILTVRWFMVMFLRDPLPTRAAMRLWDCLFTFGDAVLFAAGIEILRSRRADILNSQDLVEYCLHRVAQGLNAEAVISRLNVVRGDSELVDQITHFRRIHRANVLKEYSTNPPNLPGELRSRHRLSRHQELQLWASFLRPSPWSMLVRYCLPKSDMASFYQAFATHVWDAAQRRLWRDYGIVSGVLKRLFEVVVNDEDIENMSFEEFARGALALTRGSIGERMEICFRFFDRNNDGFVCWVDLQETLLSLHRMWRGICTSGEESQGAKRSRARAEADLFARMLAHKAKQAQREAESEAAGLCVAVVRPEKILGMSFRGCRIVRVVRGSQAHKLGIRPGWRLLRINNIAVWSQDQADSLISALKNKSDAFELTFRVLSHQSTSLSVSGDADTATIEVIDSNDAKKTVDEERDTDVSKLRMPPSLFYQVVCLHPYVSRLFRIDANQLPRFLEKAERALALSLARRVSLFKDEKYQMSFDGSSPALEQKCERERARESRHGDRDSSTRRSGSPSRKRAPSPAALSSRAKRDAGMGGSHTQSSRRNSVW